MKYRITLIVALFIVVTACSSSSKTTQDNSSIPEWLVQPPEENSEFIYASALGEHNNERIACAKSEMMIRTDLARQISQKVGSFHKFTEEIIPESNSELREYTKVYMESFQAEVRNVHTEMEIQTYTVNKNGMEMINCAKLWKYPKSAIIASLENKYSENEEYYAMLKSMGFFTELEKLLAEG